MGELVVYKSKFHYVSNVIIVDDELAPVVVTLGCREECDCEPDALISIDEVVLIPPGLLDAAS